MSVALNEALGDWMCSSFGFGFQPWERLCRSLSKRLNSAWSPTPSHSYDGRNGPAVQLNLAGCLTTAARAEAMQKSH